jgi:hypothetical protein
LVPRLASTSHVCVCTKNWHLLGSCASDGSHKILRFIYVLAFLPQVVVVISPPQLQCHSWAWYVLVGNLIGFELGTQFNLLPQGVRTWDLSLLPHIMHLWYVVANYISMVFLWLCICVIWIAIVLMSLDERCKETWTTSLLTETLSAIYRCEFPPSVVSVIRNINSPTVIWDSSNHKQASFYKDRLWI